jgi:hypothetical protein
MRLFAKECRCHLRQGLTPLEIPCASREAGTAHEETKAKVVWNAAARKIQALLLAAEA